MKIFKFGGASVKNPEAIKNVARIIKNSDSEPKLIVISAIGKTTNALEEVANQYFQNSNDAFELLEKIRLEHIDIIRELFKSDEHKIYSIINNLFDQINEFMDANASRNFSFIYDQIVSQGELLSTSIISAYLNSQQVFNHWLDVREVIRTNNAYTEAIIDYTTTAQLVSDKITDIISDTHIITQGFIGSTSERLTTTLGREGSDFTAAIFAYLLDAERLVIWKDVPGILNADPKEFPDAVKIDELSYLEAIEMTYYGAKVIHPKTIKPLQNKNIPMEVRSFINYKEPGTIIKKHGFTKNIPPIIVRKTNQTLLSMSEKDFSFVTKSNLGLIFEKCAEHRVTINMIHNGAISFSVVVDQKEHKIQALIKSLSNDFAVKRNENLELLTIRHFTTAKFDELTSGREKLLLQETRHTVQVLMR